MTTPRNDGLPELLTCPFCGGAASRYEDSGFFGVICDSCHSSTGMYCTNEHPAAAWNRRASPQPLLSREPEPVSNAGVTVGGVRVPGPMELNEANLLRYGADTWTGGTTTTNTMAGDVMTDNRGEVVIYLRGMSTMGAAAWPDPPGTPYVPQSLLLAAREECEGWRQRYLAMCALAGESELGDKQMQMEIEDATERAERAEAELAECRRDAVRYRWIVSALEIPDSVHQGIFLSDKPMTDAAIDACVGGEG